MSINSLDSLLGRFESSLRERIKEAGKLGPVSNRTRSLDVIIDGIIERLSSDDSRTELDQWEEKADRENRSPLDDLASDFCWKIYDYIHLPENKRHTTAHDT